MPSHWERGRADGCRTLGATTAANVQLLEDTAPLYLSA